MNEQNNPTESMGNSAKNVGKQAGKKVANAGKKIAKKAVKKLAKKALAKVAQVAVGIALKILAILSPYIIPILLILGVAIAGYYVLFEIRGSEQVYVYDDKTENETKKDEETGEDKTDSSLLSANTKEIQSYYRYMSQHSFWQIIGDDNEKLEQTEGEEEVRDYYQKEQNYLLDSNFLFALDETMHKKKFIYPEQFVKPVYYDPEKLELKKLTDEKGFLEVESEEYNKDGDKTDKKIKSVADYGFGSVFKYKKDEKTLTVEGTMYKKDVWDAGCNCKHTVDTNEPFQFTMDGYPEEIWLMDKAVTFVGEFEFTYEDQKTKQSELSDNAEPGNNNEAVKKVQVGQGMKMKTVYYTVTTVNLDGTTSTSTESKQVFDSWVPLYGYRKGGVYQTIPVLKETKPTDKGEEYLRDYLYNYQIYTPASVLDKFSLEARGVDSVTGLNLMDLNAGSGVGTGQFDKASQYYPIMEKYGKMYGVDPYILLAKATQESAGIAEREDGLMQIIGNGARSVKALNVSTGQEESYTVYSEGDRRDPERAIHWGAMYFANKVVRFEGDQLKALQSYNFDIGIIAEIAPQAWEAGGTEWMAYREDARIKHAKNEGYANSHSASYDCIPDRAKTEGTRYGDSCYVEHVLRYYAGTGIENADIPEGEESIGEIVGNAITNVFTAMKNTISEWVKDYSEETKYYNYKRPVSKNDIDWALRLAVAMDEYKLFSQAEVSEGSLNFWEDGYADSVNSANKENFVATTDVAGFQIPYNLSGAPITSLPGNRVDPLTGGTAFHAGTDIAVPNNTPIYASSKGKVIKIHTGETFNNGVDWGNYVKLQHDEGITSLYGHLTSLVVTNGQEVEKGQLIGYSGSTGRSTGYHLHFEMYQNGVVMDSSLIITGASGKLVPAP